MVAKTSLYSSIYRSINDGDGGLWLRCVVSGTVHSDSWHVEIRGRRLVWHSGIGRWQPRGHVRCMACKIFGEQRLHRFVCASDIPNVASRNTPDGGCTAHGICTLESDFIVARHDYGGFISWRAGCFFCDHHAE